MSQFVSLLQFSLWEVTLHYNMLPCWAPTSQSCVIVCKPPNKGSTYGHMEQLIVFFFISSSKHCRGKLKLWLCSVVGLSGTHVWTNIPTVTFPHTLTYNPPAQLWLYWGNIMTQTLLVYTGALRELIMARTLLYWDSLFTLCFIECINKALGSGATFTTPLMLLVALITF